MDFKNLFKRAEAQKRFSACVDTSFIEGTFLRLIEKDHWKGTIKEDKRLRDLNEANCLLLINDLNVYEIKNDLIKKHNVPISRVDQLYDKGIRSFRNVRRIEPPIIKVNNALINWMLENRLDFKDGVLIDIAQRLKIPFITSERKAGEWKKAYSGVMTVEEFWDKVRKK